MKLRPGEVYDPKVRMFRSKAIIFCWTLNDDLLTHIFFFVLAASKLFCHIFFFWVEVLKIDNSVISTQLFVSISRNLFSHKHTQTLFLIF